jgi:hypothetical protein
MEIIENIENKVKFIMETDWLFQDPIDFEHKRYVLLAYFKKIDELLLQNKIYPAFIELSLHLASLQTLIKEKVILSTNKTFLSYDDEVLLKELIAKSIPDLNGNERDEVDKIIKHSANQFLDYFNIVKSYWSTIYESIDMTIKRNRRYLTKPKGYIVYTHPGNNHIHVWEYNNNALVPNVDEYNINIDLIYEGNKKELSLNKVIEQYSSFTEKEVKVAPVFDFKSTKQYPIEETLLPLFKRRLLAHIYQSKKMVPLKKLT